MAAASSVLGCATACASPILIGPFPSSRTATRRHAAPLMVTVAAQNRIPLAGLNMSVDGGLRNAPSLRVSAASSRFLSNEPSSFPVINPLLPRRKRPSTVAQVLSFNFPAAPPMTEKPKWYWRFLAALPYLIPIHEAWVHAETAYKLCGFLEYFEFMTMPFYQALSRFPSWILVVYFIGAYIYIVRRREWPHFLRFHVIMGMLVSMTNHIAGEFWKSLPPGIYWGKIGAHFWAAFAFGYLFTCLACLLCALSGMYPDVPGLTDAANIQLTFF